MSYSKLNSIIGAALLSLGCCGCASQNPCPPYPVYPQQQYQAYPPGYQPQAGMPIQSSPMVGQPNPNMQPVAGQPGYGTIPAYPNQPVANPYPQQPYPGQPYGAQYGYSQPLIGR